MSHTFIHTCIFVSIHLPEGNHLLNLSSGNTESLFVSFDLSLGVPCEDLLDLEGLLVGLLGMVGLLALISLTMVGSLVDVVSDISFDTSWEDLLDLVGLLGLVALLGLAGLTMVDSLFFFFVLFIAVCSFV